VNTIQVQFASSWLIPSSLWWCELALRHPQQTEPLTSRHVQPQPSSTKNLGRGRGNKQRRRTPGHKVTPVGASKQASLSGICFSELLTQGSGKISCGHWLIIGYFSCHLRILKRNRKRLADP